ncbi:MAG: DUF58 domain-containing protein [Planctomycetia bacterium]|jgi:uncharacterized protein (DUF58 family)|nr:DUF58 domain-containing protein [Planctomycetia bacterium]
MGTGIALPPPEALGHHEFEMVVRKLANDLAHGADESIFVGSGLEYAQSRPYEAGDSIQSMDWKISARTGTPFIKEYDTLKRVPVQIVVDTSGSMVASSSSLSKYAMSTWIAAAIGLVAQRRMSPTRLIGGGTRKLPSQTSLSRGALQQAMEALRHPDAGEKTHIADALDWVRATTLQRSVVFVLSDLHDPEVIDACRRLSQGHDVAVIEFQDPVESGLTHGGFYRGSEAETGQTFLGSSKTGWGIDSNKGRRGELAEGGIDHLLLKCDQDFISPVRRFLSDRGQG